jgi:hypothetical protein
MIGSYSMTTETQQIAETIERAIEDTKTQMAPELKRITENIYQGLVESFNDYFSQDNSQNYLESIAHEVRNIMKNLLAGDLNEIKDLDILSEYTFDKLHEIRLKIWETCGNELEKCIISNQKKQIEQLTKENEYLNNRSY